MKAQRFDSWPEKYASWFATPIGALVKEFEERLMLEMLQPGADDHILDAGCGSGIFTLPLLEAGATVTGLDVSMPMLAVASQALPPGQFHPIAGNMLYLPFADEVFDRSVSVTALEFIEDAQAAVDELFRVTRPGGTVVVATLNRLGPWARRREGAARKDPSSVFREVYFRSPGDLQRLSGRPSAVRTAIHFEKSEAPGTARSLEAEAVKSGLDSGAFATISWLK